ncbi:hypothetical protein ACGFYV_37320 [Streptomyces sp. NPDC048297]
MPSRHLSSRPGLILRIDHIRGVGLSPGRPGLVLRIDDVQFRDVRTGPGQ